MAISFEYEVLGDLLRVTATGRDDSLEDVKQYGMKIIEASLQTGCTRILCDETGLEYALGKVDSFEAAKYIAEMVPGLGKAAIVCHPKYASDGEFWGTVAVNRGLEVKMCTDILEAEEWLTDD